MLQAQYFYDENGHPITDPAAQAAWVKEHPELPYGEDPDGLPNPLPKPEDKPEPKSLIS